MSAAETARGYAEALAARFHVFPCDHPDAGKRCRGIKTKYHDPDTCNERGKHPTCKWSEWSTQEVDLIGKQWYFGGNEPRNIGIDCGKSDLLVVDEDALGEFDRFCAAVGVAVPVTFTVRTSKGRHFYFQQPKDEKLGNREGAFRDFNINIRGAGGYVIGPGSKHETGVIYTAAVPTAPIECPEWLAKAPKQRASASSAGGRKGRDHWWRDHDPIEEGDRHNAIVAAAGWCRYMRIPLEDAVPTIRDVLRRCAGDKYTWDEARGKLEDVYDRYAAGDARLNPNLTDTPDADAFWSARSELSDLRDFARARRVSPWAMLGCVLAVAATRIGPHVRLPAQIGGHASLNLLVGLVGPSGAGKDAALAAASAWLAVTAPARIPVHELGTGQGIDSAYTEQTGNKGPVQHCDSCLFTCTEIDTLAAHSGMPGATITATLRKVYNGAALGARYADRFKRRPVPEHHYRFALICGIQPTHAGVLLDDPDGGTPQRWLWLPATDPHAPDHLPNEPNPRMWTPTGGYTPVGQLDTTEGVPRIGSWITLDVSQPDWNAVEERRRAQLRSTLTADADLAAHALLTRRKVAAVLDLLAGKSEVTQEGWELAGAIMDTSDATRQACITALATKRSRDNHARGQSAAQRVHIVEDAAEQRVARRLHRILSGHGDWMTGSALRREIAGRDRPLFEAAVTKLLEAGVIEAAEAENKGPTGRRYKACQQQTPRGGHSGHVHP